MSSSSPPLSSPSAQSPSPSSSLPPPIPAVTPNPPPQIKKANKPFLVHQNYKKRQAELAANPPKPNSTSSSSQPSFVATTLKTLFLTLLTSLVLSRAITQTWTWGIESKYTNPQQVRLPPSPSLLLSRTDPLVQLKALLFPSSPIILTEPQLELYDGTNPDLPLYLAIDGDVFDVSDGGRESYGPGGAYHIFAGRDAARGKPLTLEPRGESEY